jgi:hypothetical protein
MKTPFALHFARLAGLCLAMAVNGAALAQSPAPPTYAIMSLLGDSFSLTPYDGNTGARGHLTGIDLERVTRFPLPNPVFDVAAINAMGTAVRQRHPDAALELLSTANANLYAQQAKLFDAKNPPADVRESLKNMLAERHADYLVLVTKRRSQVAILGDPNLLKAADLYLLRGSSNDAGRLEGLGFHVDDAIRAQNLKTLDYTSGLLLSYINADVWLIDAKTLDVIRTMPVTKLNVVATAWPLQKGRYVWDDATDAQKFASLQQVVTAALAESVPRLLDGSSNQVSQAEPAAKSMR